jgi:hypothetical protein
MFVCSREGISDISLREEYMDAPSPCSLVKCQHAPARQARFRRRDEVFDQGRWMNGPILGVLYGGKCKPLVESELLPKGP